MSLTITSWPIYSESGLQYNLFAGFDSVNVGFKREDLPIVSVSSGVDNNILITVGTDLTTYLDPGDYIYLYAIGDNGYIYNVFAAIVTITATEITILAQYIEPAGATGYINYLKNYYIEVQIVDADNSDIKILPFSLTDDGDLNGEINIDLSILNDLNLLEFELITREMNEARIMFNIQYRQVYAGSAETFTLIDDPFILVYATRTPEIEQVINNFDFPKIYKGYDSGIIFVHSRANDVDEAIKLMFTELDANKLPIGVTQELDDLPTSLYGFLFFHWPKAKTVDPDTKYISFEGQFVGYPFFDPAFFSTFFDVT